MLKLSIPFKLNRGKEQSLICPFITWSSNVHVIHWVHEYFVAWWLLCWLLIDNSRCIPWPDEPLGLDTDLPLPLCCTQYIYRSLWTHFFLFKCIIETLNLGMESNIWHRAGGKWRGRGVELSSFVPCCNFSVWIINWILVGKFFLRCPFHGRWLVHQCTGARCPDLSNQF